MCYENRYTLKPISEVEEKQKHHHPFPTDSGEFFSETAGDLAQHQKESFTALVEEDISGEIKIITGAFKLGKVPE